MDQSKPRTMAQNRALHLMFTQLADQLNEAGFDMKRTLKEEIDIPWTAENVKEYIWRPVMVALLDKSSTTQLTSREVDRVFEVLSRHLGTKLGITITFPSLDSLYEAHQRESESKSQT